VSVQRNDDGTITVPARIEQDGIIGEGETRIGPDHPDFRMWDDWLSAATADDGETADEAGDEFP
jgi:hypothetical protein